ncbi:MAG TPA: glutaredoxin domain-containing protein [Candidatus Aquilonibacter sp.]|nr:glutaredoxin domain-containing protein [Candidatus Aquilonibacter sp.]
MTRRILLFTQPGCLSCELMRMFLETCGVVFEECDIGINAEAGRELHGKYGSQTTPTVVVITESGNEVIEGFDPSRLDQFLPAA